jgi:peroxiredoxin
VARAPVEDVRRAPLDPHRDALHRIGERRGLERRERRVDVGQLVREQVGLEVGGRRALAAAALEREDERDDDRPQHQQQRQAAARHPAHRRLPAMLARSLLLALVAALVAGTAASPARAAPQEPAGGEGAVVSPAEREWQKLYEELVPKLVRFKGLPEAERRKEDFQPELARIGAFVRKFQGTEPFYAATARVFMATQILGQALHRDRDAVVELRDVAKSAENGMLAGMAAMNAGDLLLKLGDEEALRELRELYAGRDDRDAQFLERLDLLLVQVRLQPGRKLPELALADRDGRAIDLRSYRGRALLLLVFSFEHEASRAEFDALAAWLVVAKDEGLAVVGISLDGDKERLHRELERRKVAFPVDGSGLAWKAPIVKQLGLASIPTLLLADAEGTIVLHHVGALGAELGPTLQARLAEMRERGVLPKKPAGS